MYITRVPYAPNSISIRPVEVTADHHCASCFHPALVHAVCHRCSRCCTCRLCSTCLIVKPEDICLACSQCYQCCRCVSCAGCGTIHSDMTLLCDRCGKGKPTTCSCCQHDSSLVEFSRAGSDITNLARYVPTSRQMRFLPSQRLISTEVEVCEYTPPATDLNTWKKHWHARIVTDGSLPSTGFEINTHPAGGDFWVEQIHDLGMALTAISAKVTPRAGCHFHIDCSDLGYTEMARVLFVCGMLEVAFFQMIPLFRRDSTYCIPCGRLYWDSIYNVALGDLERDSRAEAIAYRKVILKALYNRGEKLPTTTLNELRRSKFNGPRYRAINVHSYIYRGTLEFRMPAGMVQAENITNWGSMLALVVDYAVATPMAELIAEQAPILSGVAVTVFNESYVGIPAIQKRVQTYLLSMLPLPRLRDWVIQRYTLGQPGNNSLEARGYDSCSA